MRKLVITDQKQIFDTFAGKKGITTIIKNIFEDMY